MKFMPSRWILIPIFAVAAIAQQPSLPSGQGKFLISGTVVDSIRGGPLPGIEVSIRPAQSDGPPSTVVTGEDGRFKFRDLPAAKYALTARGRGYLLQGYQEHQGYWTGIVTGPGLESENLKFSLKPESSISGSVTDEFNEPVAQGQVLLFTTGQPAAPQTTFARGEVSTDDAGHYRFGHLPEGQYYVVVSARPWYARATATRVRLRGDLEVLEDTPSPEDSTSAALEQERHPEFDVAFQTTYYPNVNDPEEATPLRLKPGDRMIADFHLFAVPALRLRFRGAPPDPTRPVPTPILAERIFGQSRPVGAAGIDADSSTTEFRSLAPGHYVLQIPAGGNSAPQERPVDLIADTEVSPGKGGELVSTVSGKVELEGVGPSDSKGYVRLMNLRSDEGLGAAVSAKGEFKIDGGVRPARYNLAVFNVSDYIVKSISAVGAKIVGHQVEIPRGASVRLTIVLTKALGQIDGIALYKGKPVSQTAVLLVPDDPGHNLPLFRRDQSDSDGTFTLRQVLPGEYTLISIADGWGLEWTDPAVLKRFLAAGLRVRVEADHKYHLEAEVQPREASSSVDAAPSAVKDSCCF
jgi:Carboxypeptidase regulatory-like domain